MKSHDIFENNDKKFNNSIKPNRLRSNHKCLNFSDTDRNVLSGVRTYHFSYAPD